jgi:hypothetical protein
LVLVTYDEKEQINIITVFLHEEIVYITDSKNKFAAPISF